jgi:hypothetical protein
MSTVKLRRLRPELAVQFTLRPGERCPWFSGERCSSWPLLLNQLELGAAVLERDARNGRAILIELGLDLPPVHRRFVSWHAARIKSRTTLEATSRAAIRSLAWMVRVARNPRLATALRIIRNWITDCVKWLSVACVTLLSLVLVILLVAPPD